MSIFYLVSFDNFTHLNEEGKKIREFTFSKYLLIFVKIKYLFRYKNHEPRISSPHKRTLNTANASGMPKSSKDTVIGRGIRVGCIISESVRQTGRLIVFTL